MKHPIAHVIGFDDAPFQPEHHGDVPIIGAIFSHMRLEGVVTGKVRRDGINATARIEEIISRSRFAPQLQLILLQGITVAGFNVIDIHRLQQNLEIPAMAICRKLPDMDAIQMALLEKVPSGRRKWQLIKRAGPMEPVANVYIQRAGISYAAAEAFIKQHAVHSDIPEPLRTAHLIASGLAGSNSQQRVKCTKRL